jgi:hypothetical protein
MSGYVKISFPPHQPEVKGEMIPMVVSNMARRMRVGRGERPRLAALSAEQHWRVSIATFSFYPATALILGSVIQTP